ncbi:hypothetical protein [Microlunatus ginsengisoli]|uniref:Uncharacterized protein n=1 Tax=Microlunatus ginsengisoli TaxID=363863 RepID=A0ABP7ACC8_9ACTN
MTVRFDAGLVERVCRAATRSGGGVVEVVTDRLDGSVWVRLSSWRQRGEARRALTAFGLSSRDGSGDVTLQVTGWDGRLLRRRLGSLLALVDDLGGEWETTVELAEYCYDRRAVHGLEPDPADVLADVEAILRRAVPLPHPVPAVTDVDVLLELIDAAEDTYERRLAEHLDHAERAITRPRSAID